MKRTAQRATAPEPARLAPQTEQTEVPNGMELPHFRQVLSGGAIMSSLVSKARKGKGGESEDRGLKGCNLHQVQSSKDRLAISEEL